MNEQQYNFSSSLREAYERLIIPMAVYQFINNKVVTLIVSDGLCKMTGIDRYSLVHQYDENMFQNVHPEDVEMLAEIGYLFARDGGNYDVVYRTRKRDGSGYRSVHAVGSFQQMDSGSRVAFLYYSDITDHQTYRFAKTLEVNEPRLNFLDKNMGPIAVIGDQNHRMIYYNNAFARLIAPKRPYDSGITFEEFFYPDYPNILETLPKEGTNELSAFFDPYSGRNMGFTVISSDWGSEDAKILFFYPDMQDYQTEESWKMNQKRIVFHSMLFSSKRPKTEAGSGYRIWNLTQDTEMSMEFYSLQKMKTLGSATFDEYINSLRQRCIHIHEREALKNLTRDSILANHGEGMCTHEYKLTLQSQSGLVCMTMELLAVQSPDTGDLYIKVWEENVTEIETMRKLALRAIRTEYEYVAYMDFLADRCWMLYGNHPMDMMESIDSETLNYSKTAFILNTLEEVFDVNFSDAFALAKFLNQKVNKDGEIVAIKEQPDNHVKKYVIQMPEKNSPVIFILCTDVTNVLAEEIRQRKDLQLAKDEILEANQILHAAVKSERDKVEAILVQTVLAVSKALDAKDPYTSRHSERVAEYAVAIAVKLGYSDKKVGEIYHIALVHDIGKIGIPDEILLKPESLSNCEYEMIKRHVKIGSHILKDFHAIEHIYEGILYHHERYDGYGYLSGMKGTDIPIEARIIGIADAVDAMYSDRPYREKQSKEYILQELEAGRGKQFDPELVDIMIALIEEGLLEE